MLRSRLELVEGARRQASALGLTVSGQYTSFVPWPGDRILTTVVATPFRDIRAAGFSFPLVGRLPYKGFFDEQAAEAEARKLRAAGFDTCVSPVPAYSTLGWLNDPVTEPMLRTSRGRIVETVIHELVHATVFVPGDADFNESVATFVGQEASARFFADPEEAAAQRARVHDTRLLARELSVFGSEVEALYLSQVPDEDLPAQRGQLEPRLRHRIAGLPFHSHDREAAARIAQKIRLNDACLALRGTYATDLPAFEERLASLDDDLTAFVAELREAALAGDPRPAFLHGATRAPRAGSRPTLRARRSSDGSAESPAHPKAARGTDAPSE